MHSISSFNGEVGKTLASVAIQVPAHGVEVREHSCSSDAVWSQESKAPVTCMRLTISILTRVFVCAPHGAFRGSEDFVMDLTSSEFS